MKGGEWGKGKENREREATDTSLSAEMHQNRQVVPDPKWRATQNGSRESGCVGNGDGGEDLKDWEVALKLRARSYP